MFDDPNDVVYLKDLKKDLNKQCKMSWLPVCHVKQRGNRFNRTKNRGDCGITQF